MRGQAVFTTFSARNDLRRLGLDPGGRSYYIYDEAVGVCTPLALSAERRQRLGSARHFHLRRRPSLRIFVRLPGVCNVAS